MVSAAKNIADNEAMLSVLPLKVDAAKHGVGSFITIDMLSQKEKSKFHLWVYLCDWRIAKGGVNVMSSSELYKSGSEIELLAGRILRDISIDQIGCTFHLKFDGGVRMSIKSNLDAYTASDDMFMLYFEDGRVLAFSPGRGLYWTH